MGLGPHKFSPWRDVILHLTYEELPSHLFSATAGKTCSSQLEIEVLDELLDFCRRYPCEEWFHGRSILNAADALVFEAFKAGSLIV